jgi:glycosyltransferase involved in cell wall biosynthesis
MRILLTADPGLPVPPSGYGGVERIIDSLVGEYQRKGHTVGLLAETGSSCKADSLFAWPTSAARPRPASFDGAVALSRCVRSFEPDVLHSFSRLAFMVPQMPRALPKIMSYQRHAGGGQIRLASLLSHGTLRFTGCSDFICSMGRKSGGKWNTVHNFVDLGKYSFQATVDADAPLVFLSRIESIKGPDIAIEVARASGRRLILAGNKPKAGPELAFWNERIEAKLGRDGVEWIGEVNDAQKNELLQKAAALVVPIQWDEPFGIVFVEALACGTPVITCARGAAPEIIKQGHTGFFIHDVESGAAAVAKLGSVSRKTCRESAEKEFGSTSCAAQYLEILEAGIK